MQSRRCNSCGLVGWADAGSCKGCGTPFEMASSQVFPSSNSRAQKPNITFALAGLIGFLAALLFSVARPVIGGLAFPAGLLSLSAGLVMSILALIRIKQGSEGGPRWRAIVGIVANGGLLSFGVIAPLAVLPALVKSQPPQWQEYISQPGRYTMQFPAKATEEYKTIPGPAGALPMYTAEASLKGNGACASFYYDLSKFNIAVSEDEMLDKFVQKFVSSGEGTLISRKNIDFGGSRGVEIETKPNPAKYERNALSVARIIWVPGRSSLFMNIVTGTRSSQLYQERYKFLDSLKLITSQEMGDKYSSNVRRPE